MHTHQINSKYRTEGKVHKFSRVGRYVSLVLLTNSNFKPLSIKLITITRKNNIDKIQKNARRAIRTTKRQFSLSSVSVSFEMKPQLENIIVELATETSFVRIFPFSVDDFESDIFVRRPGVESQDCEIRIILANSLKKKKNRSRS